MVVFWGTAEPISDRVTSVELKGLSPIGDEDVCGIRLGDPSARILEVFASVAQFDAGGGYVRYETDDNISFETKADRVYSIKILIDTSKGLYIEAPSGEAYYFSIEDLDLAPGGTHTEKDLLDAFRKLARTGLPAVSGSCAARRDVYLRFLKD